MTGTAPTPAERTFFGAEAYAGLEPAFARRAGQAATPPFATVPPGAALRSYVARLHLCREAVPAGTVVHERVLPDGALYLQLHLGDAPSVVPHDGSHGVSATDLASPGAGSTPGGVAEVAGAAAVADVLRLAGRVEGVSVELRPGAALAVLGVAAGELAGHNVPLDAMWAGDAEALLEQVAAAPHGPARAAALERALARGLAARLGRRDGRRARREDAGTRIVVAALQRVRAAGGRVSVRDLAADVGLTPRRLEQLFHAHAGLTPKAACRLARFHASVRLARQAPALGWSEVAFASGYADQAHLAREYRAIAGLAPGAVRHRLSVPPDFAFRQDAPTLRR